MTDLHEYHLPNGMTLLLMPQTALHSMVFGLYFKGGTLYENRSNQGITHLLEHLCFRELGGLSGEKVSKITDRMGTEMDGATYPEGLSFSLRIHPKHFDSALDLFQRFFADIPWTKGAIEKEKQVVLRQIEQEEWDFDDEVLSRYRKTTSGAFPLMGTAESVSAMTESTIRRWQRLIFQPCNACLCVSGNFSAAMESAVAEAFSLLPARGGEPPFFQPVPIGFGARDAKSDFVQNEEGGQAKVHIAFDVDDNQVFALTRDVLCAMTGGNDTSLLFREMREEMALVAEIDSTIEDVGAFHRLVIRYDVRQEKLEESLRVLFSLLRRLTLYIRPVRLSQLEAQFTDNLSFLLDSAVALNELMGFGYLSEDLSETDLETRALQFQSLTTEEVQNAAQAVFRPENLVISLRRDPAYGPKNIKKLLAELRNMLG